MMAVVLLIPSTKFQQGSLMHVPSAIKISTDLFALKIARTPIRSKATSKILEREVGYLRASLVDVFGLATFDFLSKKISQT